MKQALFLLLALVCFHESLAVSSDWVDLQEVDSDVRAFPCPNEADIYPCACDYVDDKIYLECSNVTSDAEFANVFLQDFPVKTIYELRVTYNEFLQKLTMSTNGVSFERMMFTPGPFKITEISADFLAYSRSTLEDFSMQNAPITNGDIPSEYFDSLPNLHRLYFEGTQITQVPKFNSTTLRDLRLTIANITDLAPDTFDSANFLYNLNLQYNRIERLQVNVFPIYFETVRIRLDFNYINKIERRAFYDASINGSAGLSFLYLDNNDITQLDIESIPMTKTSRIISLQNNKISRITSSAAFYGLTEPKLHNIQLLMANNQMTTLEENKWVYIMKYLSLLDLANNPLECGCDIAWMVLNTAYLSKISAQTTCYDGRFVQDLDPQTYLELCGAK